MPAPTSALATLRPDLESSLEEFNEVADRESFIGNRILPTIDVDAPSGTFGRIPMKYLLAGPVDTRRTSGSGYKRRDWKFEPDSYQTEEHGIEEPVDDRLAKMYGSYFSAEAISARRARDAVLRNAEQRKIDLVLDTGTFEDAAAAAYWSSYSTATPMVDIETQILAFYAASGQWPNTVVMSRIAYRHVRRCDEIIDLCKAQGFMDVRPGKVSAEQLSVVFDIPNVWIAGGSKNTANPAQTAVVAQMWDKTKVLIARVATTDDVTEPCIGRTFHWAADGSQIGGLMESYRDETVRADIIRCRQEVDEKIMYDKFGRILTGVLA